MDYFYDGQIRRYVTQFMRIFIGFSYKAGDGTLKQVPVMYGDMTRQVANIIKENSENKLSSVPKIACYITGLELDRSRLADATFVSKVNIRERRYEEYDQDGNPVYQNSQGGNYTVERLMPTPFKLSMRADIWTSNTDQQLQLLEQILVLFNPSLEVQTTDNYIDWTSLSVVDLVNSQFTNRTIPQGTESDINISTLDFEMPIFISPPVKVKKLGVVQNIIMNMFTETGDLKPINELVFNSPDSPDANPRAVRVTPGGFGILVLNANNGNANEYNVSVLSPNEAVQELGLDVPIKLGDRIDWNIVLNQYEGFRNGISKLRLLQPDNSEVVGFLTVNPIDSSYLLLTVEEPQIPTGLVINAIVNPLTFNPETVKTPGSKFLLLDDVGNLNNDEGASAWKNQDGTDFVANANDIVEWNGSQWSVIFDSQFEQNLFHITNSKTGIRYKWDEGQWLKTFEGEYSAGYWSLDLNP